jgi:hypothetical protein
VTDHLTSCPTCAAAVREDRLDDHLHWHRTLTNIPMKERTMEHTEIGWAIQQMRNGAKVARRGWNGPGQHLSLQVPDEGSKMTLPYIYISTVTGDLVPWLASQTDILASDWEVVA